MRADGLVIVAPEYNHGYPGILKHALDTNLKEYIHKPVGLCGVSAGGFGGTRVIESLLPVMRELGMVTIFLGRQCLGRGQGIQRVWTPVGFGAAALHRQAAGRADLDGTRPRVWARASRARVKAGSSTDDHDNTYALPEVRRRDGSSREQG